MINLKKKTKKKIRLFSIIIVLFILIFLTTLFFLGIKINFLIGDELTINLNVEKTEHSIESGNTLKTTFTVDVDNFFRCESFCHYDLLDLSDDTIIKQENFKLNHSTKYVQELTIPPKNQGNKLNLYSLEIKCHNLKSLICLTEQEDKYNSEIIFVESTFNEKETKLNDQLRDDLNLLINQAEMINLSILNYTNRLNLLYPHALSVEGIKISAQLNDLKFAFNQEQKELQKQIEIWQKSNLNNFNTINQIIPEFVKIEQSLNNVSLELNSLIQLRNQTINLLNNLMLEQDQIVQSYNFSPVVVEELTTLNKNYQTLITQQKNITFSERSIFIVINQSKDNLDQQIKEYYLELDRLEQKYSNFINLTPSFNHSCNDLILLKEKINQSINLSSDLEQNVTLENNLMNITELENFINQNCLFNQTEILFPNLSMKSINFKNLSSLPQTNFTLTIAEQQKECCAFETCRDYYEQNKNYPVLFIHGHAFNEGNTPEASTAAFAKIQREMQTQGFINMGQLDLSSQSEEIKKCSYPLTMRATYYYLPYLSFGNYKVTVRKSERIENYALRLKEIITEIKTNTGKEKINIVAHSMGGLVVREYISLFGQEEFDKIILINSPNHGVTGKIQKYCSLIGASKECEDLSAGSVFLQRLNSEEIPKGIYNIYSIGCQMENNADGDGIVTKESAYLEGAKNKVIRGTCTDALQSDLHSNILDPEKYPKTIELILEILNE